MDAEILVTAVETAQTRSGNTRYVVRDDAGNEYSTFRPQIGEEAGRFEGRRAVAAREEGARGGGPPRGALRAPGAVQGPRLEGHPRARRRRRRVARGAR